MAKVTIGGEEIDLEPLRFRQKIQIGPLIDRLNELLRSSDPTNPKLAMAYEMVDIYAQIIAVGTQRNQKPMTADGVRDALLDVSEEMGLSAAVNALLLESGIGGPAKKGEALANDEAPVAASRSPRKSRGSSPS